MRKSVDYFFSILMWIFSVNVFIGNSSEFYKREKQKSLIENIEKNQEESVIEDYFLKFCHTTKEFFVVLFFEIVSTKNSIVQNTFHFQEKNVDILSPPPEINKILKK
nr:hypothetical protein [uncultured Flavobacterium sp.]